MGTASLNSGGGAVLAGMARGGGAAAEGGREAVHGTSEQAAGQAAATGQDAADGQAAGTGQDAADGQALARVPAERETEPLPFRRAIARMPVEVDVVVPVRNFRVRNLLVLDPGQVVESQWSLGNDVPLTAGEVRLAWTEFEVIENQLAVRVTRLP